MTAGGREFQVAGAAQLKDYVKQFVILISTHRNALHIRFSTIKMINSRSVGPKISLLVLND